MIRAALLVGVCLMFACDRPQKPSPENDPTVKRLVEELKNAPPSHRPVKDPNGELAKLATNGGTGTQAVRLAGMPTAKVGALSLTVQGATARNTIQTGAIAVTSETPFLELSVELANAGAQPARIDLSRASLQRGGDVQPIAGDAQHLAGTRQLAIAVPPHGSTEVKLFFVNPAPAKSPLTLVVPGADGLRLPLE